MTEGTIFNIQHFSVHDGPGIRTTIFFKGCPLNCAWCHNPESIGRGFDLLYDRRKCTLCGECIKRCGQGAITIGKNGVVTNMAKCRFDGKCVFYCVNSAREIAGERKNVEELVREVMKDALFYEESAGGVTLSGGEPLLQIDFVEKLVLELKKRNINVAIDTCGQVPFENFERVAPMTDIFLYDLKAMDDTTHREFTGTGNKMIIENLRRLAAIHGNIHLRMPVIVGVNDNKEHLEGVLNIAKELGIRRVSLLPYHDIATHKYSKLGRTYRGGMGVPAKELMETWRKRFEDNGIEATIGA